MINLRKSFRLLLAGFAICLPGQALLAQTTDVSYTETDLPSNMRDISASGTALVLGDDVVSGPIAIGFLFNFYGNTYSTAYVSSNGFVTFDSSGGAGCCTGQALPDPATPNNLVAGYWEDLDPPEGAGNVRVQTLGTAPDRMFVVGFYNVQHFPSGNASTFEMILHEGSDNVELQYGVGSTDGGTHSIGIESAGGIFGHQVAYGNVSIFDTGRLLEPQVVEEARATFNVDKGFDDGNTAEVAVTLSCDTGLPLEQTKMISQGNPVEFVVVDFDSAELDCDITEATPPGYSADFESHGGKDSDSPDYLDACRYEFVEHGDSFLCEISNSLDQVRVDVRKIWIDDNPQFNTPNYARADWNCYNTQFQAMGDDPALFFGCDGDTCGSLSFYGADSTDSFTVYPDWDGTTYCTVEERIFESGVESSNNCGRLYVTPGHGNGCTITNTRFYEGIPTLSQYGLAILALLMLGVGMVGFRRFV